MEEQDGGQSLLSLDTQKFYQRFFFNAWIYKGDVKLL
jgi:hypothetical protein